MTNEAIANAIRSRFKTQVADVLSLETQYDNQSLDNPDNDYWCRVTIRDGETLLKTIGAPLSNRHQTTGVMIVQLFGPIGKGTGILREKAEVVKLAFRCQVDTGIHFREPSIVNVGQGIDSWQMNVVCPFYADDIG